MKAISVVSQNDIRVQEIDTPELLPDEILCKVVYVGICGTDLAIYTGETNFVRDGLIKYPVRIGHEWSGYVEKVGSAVTKFKPGDRVVVYWGKHRNYNLVNEKNVVKIESDEQ